MRFWLIIVLLLSCLPPGRAPAAAARPPATVIYLVRHAEKEAPGPNDPPLNAAGDARAQLLAQRLSGRQPAALFTTDTRRARATLAPLAQLAHLTLLIYNAQDPTTLANRIYLDYRGRTVVVVGHANTLLPLLAALGVKPPMTEIKDKEYDYLFTVELREGQAARLKVKHYGAPPK